VHMVGGAQQARDVVWECRRLARECSGARDRNGRRAVGRGDRGVSAGRDIQRVRARRDRHCGRADLLRGQRDERSTVGKGHNTSDPLAGPRSRRFHTAAGRRRAMNVFEGARTLHLLKFIPATLCGLLLTSCMTHGAPRNGSPETDRPFSNSAAQNLEVRVLSSSYGALTIATAPGASGMLEVSVDRGTFGDGPPSSVEGSADRSGTLALRYPAPQIPPGRGRHVVVCEDGNRTASASAEFEIAPGPLDPRGLRVRLERVDATTIIAGATGRLDPR